MSLIEKENIDFGKLLSKHGLSNTFFRRQLIELFYNTHHSLSVDDVLNSLNFSINTVSVYRALDSFEKNGLIHKGPGNKNVIKYALCRNECNTEKHIHNHPHLLCSNCKETYCLHDFKVPKINTYKGFEIKNFKIIIEGHCIDCKQSNH